MQARSYMIKYLIMKITGLVRVRTPLVRYFMYEIYDSRFAGVRHLGKGLGMLLFRAISAFIFSFRHLYMYIYYHFAGEALTLMVHYLGWCITT